MGRSNRVKRKRKNPHDVKMQNMVKKEVEKYRQSSRQELLSDFTNHIAPIAERNSFMYLMYTALITARDKFGFGKDRLNRLADGIMSHYECITSGHVTPQEMSDEIFKITGIRFELTDEDLLEMARRSMEDERNIV